MTLRTAVVLLLLAGLPLTAACQVRDTSAACCRVVKVDSAGAQVTAREIATGFTFRVAVKNKRLRTNLKIGDAVWADFATNTVKLKRSEIEPCCSIVAMPTASAPRQTSKPPEY